MTGGKKANQSSTMTIPGGRGAAALQYIYIYLIERITKKNKIKNKIKYLKKYIYYIRIYIYISNKILKIIF